MNTARKMIANELLPVYQTTDKGEKVIDGRELHEFLKIGRDFTNWIKARIEKYGFIEGGDFILTLTKTGERQNVTKSNYILKLDMAKELCMVENNEQGRKARRYFIEVEKRMQNVVPLQRSSMPIVPVAISDAGKAAQLMDFIREQQDVISDETNKAIQNHVVELLTGKKIEKEQGKDGKWYLTSDIASLAGVTVQKVASIATKYDLRSPEYSKLSNSKDSKRSGLVQVMYNEKGKEKLLELLKK